MAMEHPLDHEGRALFHLELLGGIVLMAMEHPLDHEGRALFHLELLGCYEPGDAVAPYVPDPDPEHWNDDHYWNDEDDARYLGDLVTCWACGGDGNDIQCCDDLCNGQGWCMHGDNAPCRECGGEGFL